ISIRRSAGRRMSSGVWGCEHWARSRTWRVESERRLMPGNHFPSRMLLRESRNGSALEEYCAQLLERIVQLLPEAEQRICVVASPEARDGRTSLAVNLAELAGRGANSNVLIVDADAHDPRVHDVFRLSRGPGLSDVVNGVTPMATA